MSMQYKKDHTVKYGPGEMLPPAMYCNQGNKSETFQLCSIFQKLKFRVRQVFSAQTKLQSEYSHWSQQDSPKPQLMKQERGKAESMMVSLETQSWKKCLHDWYNKLATLH